MSKKQTKNSHFIPSPFPAVTEYENTFIKVWNDNTAEAVSEVLKYLAKETAFAIKNDIVIEKGLKEDLKTAEQEVELHPSNSQIESGNYKKGHVIIDGLYITIENPKGSYRSGVDDNGKSWKVKMNNTYGYFKGTKGKDGDHIDCFLGNNLESDKIFVIDQFLNNKFDEHKVMVGFNDKKAAKEAYLSNYSKGWNGLKNITEVSKEDFKKWLSVKTKKQKPYKEYTQNDI